MSNNHAHFVVYILAAIKRRRKERETGKSSELSDIFTKFIEASEESSAKRFAIEAELEEKRRDQERKHEERMMRMMMEFVCQMRQPQHNYPRPSHGSYGQSSPSVLSSPSTSPYIGYQSTFPSPTGHGQSTYDFNHGVNGDNHNHLLLLNSVEESSIK